MLRFFKLVKRLQHDNRFICFSDKYFTLSLGTTYLSCFWFFVGKFRAIFRTFSYSKECSTYPLKTTLLCFSLLEFYKTKTLTVFSYKLYNEHLSNSGLKVCYINVLFLVQSKRDLLNEWGWMECDNCFECVSANLQNNSYFASIGPHSLGLLRIFFFQGCSNWLMTDC